MDGIDVAHIETDGRGRLQAKGFISLPYTPAFRKKLRSVLGKEKAPAVEKELTALHARAVRQYLKKYKMKADDVDVIGFHGHTLLHAPQKKKTVQIGDGAALAKAVHIPVVYDFRSDDVRAGGQGAPLVPVYHQALATKFKKPIAFLNIGGVANVTFIDAKGNLLAFDTGPGGALLDDWVQKHTGSAFDKNGALAAKGQADIAHVKAFLKHPYFKKVPPKSLDRDAFRSFIPHHLNAADGAATLSLMTALSIAQGLKAMPQKPKQLVVCGGGRKNIYLMKLLAMVTGLKTTPIEKLKQNGDATEAEAFAYLAVRVLLGLPITFKGTTGRKT